MQVRGLVRSLSLKVSRENLAARENDVETPDVVEEELGEVDNAHSEAEAQELGSKEEDLSKDSESKGDSSKSHVSDCEEVETVESPAEQTVDESSPCEELCLEKGRNSTADLRCIQCHVQLT